MGENTESFCHPAPALFLQYADNCCQSVNERARSGLVPAAGCCGGGGRCEAGIWVSAHRVDKIGKIVKQYIKFEAIGI